MDSLNPQILPSSLSRKDHRKSSLIALWAAIAAIAIGLIYWGLASKKAVETPPVTPSTATSTVSTEAQNQRAMVEQLNSSVSQVTSADMAKMKTSLLRSKSSVSAAQMAEMVSQLKSR